MVRFRLNTVIYLIRKLLLNIFCIILVFLLLFLQHCSNAIQFFLCYRLEFNVAYNALTGLVPYELNTWSSIEDFQIQGNNLAGEIGPPICSMIDWHRDPFANELTFISDCLVAEEFFCPCCTECCDSEGNNCQVNNFIRG